MQIHRAKTERIVFNAIYCILVKLISMEGSKLVEYNK